MTGDCKTSDDGVLSCPMEDILAGDIGIIYGHAESFLPPKGNHILTSTSFNLTTGFGNVTPRKTRYNKRQNNIEFIGSIYQSFQGLYQAKSNKILQREM